MILPHLHCNLHVAITGLFLLLFSVTASALEHLPLAQPASINGSITLNGCDASNVQLLLKATPLVPQARNKHIIHEATDRRRHQARHDRPQVVRAEQTGDRSFVFQFDGLQESSLYRLGIKVLPAPGTAAPPNPCRDLVWQGLPSSIALAGGAELDISGSAMNGALRVFNAPPDNAQRRWPRRFEKTWSRAGAIDLADPAGATPQMRWQPPAGVSQGMMQIALEPFERKLNVDNCVTPEGMVYQGDIDISDLTPLRGGSYLLPAVDLSAVLVPPTGDGIIVGELPIDELPEDIPLAQPPTISAGEYQKILLGKPLYVRVVPVTADGPMCELSGSGIPPWVILAIIDALNEPEDPPLIDDISIDPVATYIGPVVYNLPNQNHMCMRSTKAHKLKLFGPLDIQAANSANLSIGDTFPNNRRFCFTVNKDSGGFDPLDTLGEIAGGLLSPFEWLVNGLSGAWASVKAYAINAVVDTMSQLGVNCQPTCRSLLTTGLEIGLVAAGVPPSLPNFDELKQQGLDYIASQVASQTGLPTEVTEWAVNNGYKAMASEFTGHISKARGSGMPGVDWAVWDNGIEPATLKLKVLRSAVGEVPTAVHIPASEVYAAVTIPLPKVFVDDNGQPGASYLNVNVALVPNISGWKQPDPIVIKFITQSIQIDPTAHQIAVSQKNYWKTQITKNNCVPFAINRNYVLPFTTWIHKDTVANFPGVPVMLDFMLPHKQLFLLNNHPLCQP